MGNILPAIKPTFPDRLMLQSHEYSSAKLVVIETSFLIFDECACDQFHFLIPLKQAPMIRTEGKLYTLKEMSVFPCNPHQPHRLEDTGITDFKALVLYMENTFLRTMAKELFGLGELELKSRCFAFSPAMKELVDMFIRECRAGQLGFAMMLESISVQIAITLLRESCHNLSDSSFHPASYSDEKAVKKAIEYIADNYQNRLSLFEIANETHYSPYHFLRLFKRHTGKTPFGFLLDLKIERAKDMLKKTDCTISQISDLCGFNSLSHFSHVFKEKTGLSPSRYKKYI
ncbi:MAG: helix-turn-helix transcriptional regulator [Clostridiales bacterium]|jgi:AraC-like DNA-binding protein|nr:helix-turn-helix transcriptional regulator [Clostridiales bacterium]